MSGLQTPRDSMARNQEEGEKRSDGDTEVVPKEEASCDHPLDGPKPSTGSDPDPDDRSEAEPEKDSSKDSTGPSAADPGISREAQPTEAQSSSSLPRQPLLSKQGYVRPKFTFIQTCPGSNLYRLERTLSSVDPEVDAHIRSQPRSIIPKGMVEVKKATASPFPESISVFGSFLSEKRCNPSTLVLVNPTVVVSERESHLLLAPCPSVEPHQTPAEPSAALPRETLLKPLTSSTASPETSISKMSRPKSASQPIVIPYSSKTVAHLHPVRSIVVNTPRDLQINLTSKVNKVAATQPSKCSPQLLTHVLRKSAAIASSLPLQTDLSVQQKPTDKQSDLTRASTKVSSVASSPSGLRVTTKPAVNPVQPSLQQKQLLLQTQSLTVSVLRDEKETCSQKEFTVNSRRRMERLLNTFEPKYKRQKFEERFKCKRCERSFTNELSRNLHLKEHEEVTFICCGINLINRTSLDNHVQAKHSGVKPTTRETNFNSNLRTFMGPKIGHHCEYCDLLCRDVKALEIHIFRYHRKDKISQEMLKLKCPHCNHIARGRNKLVCHLRIHTGEKPFECTVCGAKFRVKESLKSHSRVHTRDKQTFACKRCEKRFTSDSGLQEHMGRDHLKTPPLECGDCGRMFYDQNNRARHISKAHMFLKSHGCDICGKPFFDKQELKAHKKTHEQANLLSPGQSGNDLTAIDCS